MDNSTQNTIKLQAFMAHAGIASRRKSEELIADGQVLVNGEVAHIGQRVNPHKDTIQLGKQKVNKVENPRYFLVNKPLGIISSTSDELHRKTVVDLITGVEERLYPVGRLDQDSEGLMLLTNDGALANKLTHPRYHIAKTYQATVTGRPTSKALEHLRRGVKLNDGYTQPAEVEVTDETDKQTILEITIYEGRNRQVRRMMDRIGYPVEKLIRTKLGPFSLADLQDKRYLELPYKVVHQLLLS